MKFAGEFINDKDQKVSWRFVAPNEEALKEHLQKIGWKPVGELKEVDEQQEKRASSFLDGDALGILYLVGFLVLWIAFNWIRLVVFGDITASEFSSGFYLYNFGWVEDLKTWAQQVSYRIHH